MKKYRKTSEMMAGMAVELTRKGQRQGRERAQTAIAASRKQHASALWTVTEQMAMRTRFRDRQNGLLKKTREKMTKGRKLVCLYKTARTKTASWTYSLRGQRRNELRRRIEVHGECLSTLLACPLENTPDCFRVLCISSTSFSSFLTPQGAPLVLL